jgi:hypothetical protein
LRRSSGRGNPLPAASPASSALSSRSANDPVAATYASAIAGQTSALAIMFAWAENPSPVTWPASAMQQSPVCAAARPWASTIPTWRTCCRASAVTSAASARSGGRPARMSSSPSGPYERSENDWLATAPTPDSAQGTTEPTANAFVCTATPSSPVAESRATRE